MRLTDLLRMLFQSALSWRPFICFPMDHCQRAYKDQVTRTVFLLVSTLLICGLCWNPPQNQLKFGKLLVPSNGCLYILGLQ